MIGELTDDFILSGDEINAEDLFDPEATAEDTSQQQEEIEDTKETKDTEETTENQVDPEDLFDSESVGSGKTQDGEETKSTQNKVSPNNSNFYSSIASALRDEGIFPDLDDSAVESIKSPEDFVNSIEQQIQARLTEKQKRIDAALQANVEPNQIRAFENTIANLDAIKEEYISDETEKGENLRKQLIYQDFINRGYSDTRAKREVEKSFNAGTDIDDAKEALESNKEYFNSKYQELLNEAKEEAEERKREVQNQLNELKKSMVEDKEIFEGISIDKATRQRAYESVTKPIYKSEDGNYLTAVQKYAMENPVDFRKKLGVLFTMTDGFKNINNLIKTKVKREVKQSLRDLESKLVNTSQFRGNPTYVSSVDDTDSSFRGWDLDI